MGGYMSPATSEIAPIFGQSRIPMNKVNEALNMFGGSDAFGRTSPSGGYGEDWISGLFGNNTLQNLGGMFDIGKDLFGMYLANKGMKAGINSMNNQAIAYNNNAQNQQNFTNGVIDAFGSGQQRTNNQMARQFS